MNVDGSGLRNLTRNPLRDGEDGQRFLWSPDGSRIAFASNRDGNVEIYVMNADGGGQRRIHVSESKTSSWMVADGRKLVIRREGDEAAVGVTSNESRRHRSEEGEVVAHGGSR